ncbi:hypothetical protein SOCE26_001480 [Sorangium cellulosum]|uniref:DUF5615 domain-containing protein n=1 Tax=Sorangium cellulosum TaxID=56 RepID=A0A2L0EHJ4_SORCE|nr:hypothetical protein SOCE26_001480 [Sorangium cellulosum]
MLLDQGLPRSAAERLRTAGVDAIHVAEIGMWAALDEEILEQARQSKQVVVTLDADFHALLALADASAPSVLRLRVERLNGEACARLILDVLAVCGSELLAGVAATADLTRIRLRRLPLTDLGR